MIAKDLPKPLGKCAALTRCFDANPRHGCIAGRPVTGLLRLLSEAPINWRSKKQAAAEAAVHGSKFASARARAGQAISLRMVLRHLGAPARNKSRVLGGNKKAVIDSQASQATQRSLLPSCERSGSSEAHWPSLSAWQPQPCWHAQQALGLPASAEGHAACSALPWQCCRPSR